MELTSSHWSFDPKTFAIDPDLSALLDLRLDLYDETNLEALNAGLWWVYPLGRNYMSRLIGLRLMPGTPLAQSPIVIAKDGAVVTLCSRPSVLVPQLFFRKMATGRQRWDEVKSLSAAQWEAAVALHRAFGGEDELQGVKALAEDQELAANFERGVPFAAGRRARATGFAQLDPGPETAAYYAYAAEAAVAKTTATAMPEVGRPWSAAVAALAFAASRHERAPEGARELELEAAWRLMHEPPALDTSRNDATLHMDPSASLSRELGISAAKVVVKRQRPEWASDLRMPAITALATTESYDGTAHLEAAAKLAANDVGSAFTALTAASFWSFHAEGKAKPEALDKAIELVRAAGIADLGDALEQQRHAHQAILAQVAREQPEDEDAGDEDSE